MQRSWKTEQHLQVKSASWLLGRLDESLRHYLTQPVRHFCESASDWFLKYAGMTEPISTVRGKADNRSSHCVYNLKITVDSQVRIQFPVVLDLEEVITVSPCVIFCIFNVFIYLADDFIQSDIQLKACSECFGSKWRLRSLPKGLMVKSLCRLWDLNWQPRDRRHFALTRGSTRCLPVALWFTCDPRLQYCWLPLEPGIWPCKPTEAARNRVRDGGYITDRGPVMATRASSQMLGRGL